MSAETKYKRSNSAKAGKSRIIEDSIKCKGKLAKGKLKPGKNKKVVKKPRNISRKPEKTSKVVPTEKERNTAEQVAGGNCDGESVSCNLTVLCYA